MYISLVAFRYWMGMIRSGENWDLKNKRPALICLELFTPFSLHKALPFPALVRGAEWEGPAC